MAAGSNLFLFTQEPKLDLVSQTDQSYSEHIHCYFTELKGLYFLKRLSRNNISFNVPSLNHPSLNMSHIHPAHILFSETSFSFYLASNLHHPSLLLASSPLTFPPPSFSFSLSLARSLHLSGSAECKESH